MLLEKTTFDLPASLCTAANDFQKPIYNPPKEGTTRYAVTLPGQNRCSSANEKGQYLVGYWFIVRQIARTPGIRVIATKEVSSVKFQVE
jgi:hypothetical protein